MVEKNQTIVELVEKLKSVKLAVDYGDQDPETAAKIRSTLDEIKSILKDDPSDLEYVINQGLEMLRTDDLEIHESASYLLGRVSSHPSLKENEELRQEVITYLGEKDSHFNFRFECFNLFYIMTKKEDNIPLLFNLMEDGEEDIFFRISAAYILSLIPQYVFDKRLHLFCEEAENHYDEYFTPSAELWVRGNNLELSHFAQLYDDRLRRFGEFLYKSKQFKIRR
jgi:hypothetical protein